MIEIWKSWKFRINVPPCHCTASYTSCSSFPCGREEMLGTFCETSTSREVPPDTWATNLHRNPLLRRETKLFKYNFWLIEKGLEFRIVTLYTILASRASGCLFGHPKPYKKHPSGHPNCFVRNFWNVNLKHIFELFHLHIIPITLYKDIMPYFDKFTHVYGWNLSILWSPIKIWTSKNFKTANLGHPVSKSWLWPWTGHSSNVNKFSSLISEWFYLRRF